jgi:hypothetical protein
MLVALGVTGPFGTSTARAATGHHLVAHYSGQGSGLAVDGAVSGSATLSGRGSLTGTGSLSGSAHGRFVTRTCVIFTGSAVLKGSRGSLALRASGGHACAGAAGGNAVSFSGAATVVSGTGAFLHAHGRVTFSGTYARDSGAVTLSLRGVVTY